MGRGPRKYNHKSTSAPGFRGNSLHSGAPSETGSFEAPSSSKPSELDNTIEKIIRSDNKKSLSPDVFIRPDTAKKLFEEMSKCIYCKDRKNINGQDGLCRTCRRNLETVTYCPTCGGEKTAVYSECIDCRYKEEDHKIPGPDSRRVGPGPSRTDIMLEEMFVKLERENEDKHLKALSDSAEYKRQHPEYNRDGGVSRQYPAGQAPPIVPVFFMSADAPPMPISGMRPATDAEEDTHVRRARITKVIEMHEDLRVKFQSGEMQADEVIEEAHRRMFLEKHSQ